MKLHTALSTIAAATLWGILAGYCLGRLVCPIFH